MTIHPYGTIPMHQHQYSVICARMAVTQPDGSLGWRWIFVRHGARDTWEIPGGRIEPGETPADCAARELYEETGGVLRWLQPAFEYGVSHEGAAESYGTVFLAEVSGLDALPQGSEIGEVRLFDALPDALTYPHIQPVIFAAMLEWLAANTPDEYRDLLDENRQPLGRVHRRGTPQPPDTFVTVVRAWCVNAAGEVLITRRCLTKMGSPGLWEAPAGSVCAGEDSRISAARELAEESGIVVPADCGELFFTKRHDFAFWDNWLFRHEFDLADVVLQPGETMDARKATPQEILQMMDENTFGDYVREELEKLIATIRA